jgi:polyhydroxyalkanoate synthesis regulator protein
VIRSYGAGVRSVMGNYLEQSLKLFSGQSVGRGPQG